MREIRLDKKVPRFVPDFMADSLYDIDFELLQKRGIKHIAFDADSTLVSFLSSSISVETEKFLKEKQHLFKSWCIASNRLGGTLKPLANSIGAELVQATPFTRKPSRRFFKRVLSRLEAEPEQTAMIGDKLIADMWGAKRVGMTTVWVERLGRDNPIDNLLRVRRIEKKLMQAYLAPRKRR